MCSKLLMCDVSVSANPEIQSFIRGVHTVSLPIHIAKPHHPIYPSIRYGAFRGIGVRIEDDVLVTPNGCEVLSAGVTTSPVDLEALVGTGTLG